MQGHGEGEACKCFSGYDIEFAAMGASNFPHNEQTQPQALLARARPCPEKRLKQPLQHVWRNRRSVIGIGHFKRIIDRVHVDMNGFVYITICKRIGQQVGKHL